MESKYNLWKIKVFIIYHINQVCALQTHLGAIQRAKHILIRSFSKNVVLRKLLLPKRKSNDCDTFYEKQILDTLDS